MKHILIVNAILILFGQNSFSQDEKFLYKFKNGIDSIGTTNLGATQIFLYNPDYEKEFKAYKIARSKLDPQVPISPAPPFKFYPFFGYEVPTEKLNYFNYKEINKKDLLEEGTLPKAKYYSQVQMKGGGIKLFVLERMIMTIE